MSIYSYTSNKLVQKTPKKKLKHGSLAVEYNASKPPSITPTEKLRALRKTLKKPQPKIKPPLPLERIHAKKSIKEHCFTAAAKVNDENQRDLFQETTPFVYPKDLEEFSYRVMSKAWRDNLRAKELKYKASDRNNYRTRQQADLLNRLYVKEAEITGMKTIVDIDPEFYSLVEGRPLMEKFDVRKYVQSVRDVLRTRIVTGFREDDVILIDENIIEEQRLIDETRAAYQKYVDTFEEFLFENHTESMKLLRQSEKEAGVASELYEQYCDLSKEYGKLKYVVYNLEEKWRNCKMYQKFLYLVSPVYWRRRYDYYHLTQKESHMSLATELSSVFGRYKLPSTGDVLSLEDLVEQFLDDCRTQDDPLIFFDNPKQLIKAFRFIEIQNLNTLLHIEELAGPTETVKEGIRNARLVFETEMSNLQEIIDSLEDGIIWEEQRAESLEQFAGLLIGGPFKELVAAEEVLNLYVFVEDVFEARIAPNDAKINLYDMMKAIEMKYRYYLLQLDTLPQQQVIKAETECFADFAKIKKMAEEAARKVLQIERLTYGMKRALEPPFKRKTKELKWRSPPVTIPKPPPPPPRPLTSKETDYLTFFTEFCKHTDSLEEYGIDLMDGRPRERKDETNITPVQWLLN